ncbi:hypothetical protein D3C84_1230590 [compost metagenome]
MASSRASIRSFGSLPLAEATAIASFRLAMDPARRLTWSVTEDSCLFSDSFCAASLS